MTSKLKSIRAGHRSSVSRILRRFEEKSETEEKPEEDELETILDTLKEKQDILKDLDKNILDSVQEEDIEQEILDIDEYKFILETKILGTFKIKDLIHRCLQVALESGYRSFDTASVYKNESDIGEALKKLLPEHGLQREDVFITSKLGPANQGKDKCSAACLESIQRLQCDYLDLYLIHWPGTQGKKPEELVNKELRLQSWQDMIQLHKEGKVKAIGVSNFLQHHIEDIILETSVVPAVLQIEHHPHLVQDNLISYCKEKGIHFQAYSSLGTSVVENKLLSDETVKDIAKIHSKTTAQILLKWAVQQNIGVIPKSTNPDHIRENMDIFDFSLSQRDIDILNKLDKQIHYCWNPKSVS